MAAKKPFRGSSLKLNDKTGEAYWCNQELDLSPEAYSILRRLARESGQVVVPHELWGPLTDEARQTGDFEKANLTRYVNEIRSAFERIDSQVDYLEMLPKRGYQWSEPKQSLFQVLVNFLNSAGKSSREQS